MKKIIIVLIFLFGQLHALEPNSTLKLYHHLFSSFSLKKSVSVYVEDNAYKNIFLKSSYIHLVQDIGEADFILLTTNAMLKKLKNKALPKETIVITDNYTYMEQWSGVVGAFYYRKGRSQFLFLKPRLDEHNITLPLEYDKYIVDEL